MKKVLIAILAVLYLGTSTGATLHMHYCMGKLADWGFQNENAKKCGACGMEKTDNEAEGCCKDDQKFIKNESDQKLNQSGIDKITLTAVAPITPSFEPYLAQVTSIQRTFPSRHAPPRDSGVAIHILHCLFLI